MVIIEIITNEYAAQQYRLAPGGNGLMVFSLFSESACVICWGKDGLSNPEIVCKG